MDMQKWAAGLDSGADFVAPSADVRGCLVYGPLGQLKYIRTGPGLCSSTAGIVVWDKDFGRFRINPRLAEQPTADDHPAWGWYEVLCNRTGMPQYHDKAAKYHERMAKAKRNGQARPLTPKRPGPKTEKDPDGMKGGHRPNPPDWYHPVLEARRQNHDAGRPVLEWNEILEIDESGDVPVIRTGAPGLGTPDMEGLEAFSSVVTDPDE